MALSARTCQSSSSALRSVAFSVSTGTSQSNRFAASNRLSEDVAIGLNISQCLRKHCSTAGCTRGRIAA